MTIPAPRAAETALPTRWSAAVFAGKAALLRLRRSVSDARAGLPQLARCPGLAGAEVVGECRSPLWSDLRPAERGNQLGKVHNLRRAARALDGTVIPVGAVFSFWRQVGRASRARGFASGRMLQGGCMVRAVGGGLAGGVRVSAQRRATDSRSRGADSQRRCSSIRSDRCDSGAAARVARPDCMLMSS